MPTDIWGTPIFQFHAEQTSNPVGTAQGTLQSLAQLDEIIPAPGKIVLLERTEGEEEVRIVDESTGDYIHTDSVAVARDIITTLDERTTRLYREIQGDSQPYPAHVLEMHDGVAEKDVPYWRSIVKYDDEGIRLLPALKFAGIIDSVEEFKRLEAGPYASTTDLKDFLAVQWANTGEIWWADDAVRKQITGSRSERKEEMVE